MTSTHDRLIKTNKKISCICNNPDCKKEFYEWPSTIKEGRGKYCSNQCHGKMQIGENNPMFGIHLKHTQEEIQKIRDRQPIRIGDSNPNWRGGLKKCICQNPECDHPVFYRARWQIKKGINKYCSVECKSKVLSGSNSPLWRGGISFEPYCEKFNSFTKERIRNENNRKCFNCGLPENDNITSTGKHWKLSIHHIYYDKQEGCNGTEMRLIPLCIHCHPKTNGNRDSWIKRFTDSSKQ